MTNTGITDERIIPGRYCRITRGTWRGKVGVVFDSWTDILGKRCGVSLICEFAYLSCPLEILETCYGPVRAWEPQWSYEAGAV